VTTHSFAWKARDAGAMSRIHRKNQQGEKRWKISRHHRRVILGKASILGEKAVSHRPAAKESGLSRQPHNVNKHRDGRDVTFFQEERTDDKGLDPAPGPERKGCRRRDLHAKNTKGAHFDERGGKSPRGRGSVVPKRALAWHG